MVIPTRPTGDIERTEPLIVPGSAGTTGLPSVALGWFHRYPARFGEDVVLAMLKGTSIRLGHVPGSILDPFAGAGTTLAAARQLGIPSSGVELSQLGATVSQLRVDPPRDISRAAASVLGWIDGAPPATSEVGAELVSWIGDDNARVLTGYLRHIRRLNDAKVRRFATVAVSSALRPASRWLPGSIKAQVDPNRSPSPLGGSLRRSVLALARDCELESSGASAPARILVGDARSLPFESEMFDTVVSSPPYFVSYDYFDVQRLSYLAFGWPRHPTMQIGQRYGISPDGVGFVPPHGMGVWYRDEYRSENSVLGRALRAYFVGLKRHLADVHRVVKPGGVAAYAIANSPRGGRRFGLVGAFRHLLREAGFVDIEARLRETPARRILPAARDLDTGRFVSGPGSAVSEYIVYARRR